MPGPNFFSQDSQTYPTEQDVPSYLTASDNHNIGNTRGGSLLDPSTWGDRFENGGKLFATSLLSGLNSFYNTGVAVGNWFGADAEENNTSNWITSMDEDLGKYYDQNKTAADIGGMLLTSWVPGMGGVKILNAGQTALRTAIDTGRIGGNLARATGLLVPTTENFIAGAAKDIINSQAAFNSITQNGVKALASGVWQNVLEGAAFETMVQATMFKSPILSEQDGWDIVKNIATGGVFQGAIGGAFAAASTLGKIKSAVNTAKTQILPWAARDLAEEGTSPANKIILMTEDKNAAIARYNDLVDAGGEPELMKSITDAHNDKLRRIDNDIRSAFHEMTGGNTELGNMLADAHFGSDSNTAMSNLLGAQEITSLSKVSKLETAQAKLVKNTGVADPSISTSYVKLTGENAGTVTDTQPLVSNLADKVAGTGDIKSAVLDTIRSDYKFKPGQNWSAADLTKSSGHLEAEARQIWADSILKEIKDGTAVNQYDFPVIERALKDGQTNIKLVDNAGGVLKDGFTSTKEMEDHLVQAKLDVAAKLMDRTFSKQLDPDVSTLQIGKITNTKVSRLEGTSINQANPIDDFKAWQSANTEYARNLLDKGLSRPADAAREFDTRFLPSYAKVSRQAPQLSDINGHVIDGMTYIKQQQALIKQAVDNVVAKATGPLYKGMVDITDAQLLSATEGKVGAGLLSSANGGYGSLESIAQQLGSVTSALKKSFRGDTETALEGKLYNLLQNQKAAIEFSTVNQKVTRSAEQWVRQTGEDGTQYLVTKKALKEFTDTKTGETDLESLVAEKPGHAISLENPETYDLIDSHIARSGERTQTYRELRAAQGMPDEKDPGVFRPIRPNPKDYPYYAFVRDPSVTGQGHMSMVFAATEAKLAQLLDKVPSNFQTITSRESKEYEQAYQSYQYQRTLHENYVDSSLKNNGVMSDFFTKTDPKKIVDEILQQHLREDDTLAVELSRAKNQKVFDQLEDLGSSYTKYAASKLGSFSDRLESAGKNPYLDYIKTALDISKMGEHPLLQSANKLLDGAVSKAVAAIGDVFSKAKSPADLEQINSLLDQYGMNTGWRDAATDLLANHTAPKGELTKFIRGANGVLSKLTLGLDPLNAVTNFIGANILRGTELKQITDAIKAGNQDIAGELSKLTEISLPGDLGNITAPTKLVKNALTNFFKDDGTLLQSYKDAGYIKGYSEQFKSILNDFTLQGTESVSELNSRLSGAFAKAKSLSELGEKYTGNKLAEELNRFISANVMDQIASVGVKNGLLTEPEKAAYINTFVNRVEGNITASQRPLMFQGPIGQAIGLFQSYQFNLMQQMFRYVAEGDKKDAAMLLGLQGTFFGLQGLPAFQFINQHVVGTMSGNQKHVDMYDAMYGIAGREMGDLLTYGLPSNLLRANLYSRGDINPRQLTVLPSTLSEIPIAGAFTKFVGSMYDSVQKISNGGDVWESILQGIEHNGLSRPLAGLAQTLQAAGPSGQVFSTSNKGDILSSNDLMSWATAVRLAGGRPIDEAIVNDGVYRIQAYQQMDRQKMNQLSEAIKTSTIMGDQPSADQFTKFSAEYVKDGGKQIGFNKFMMNEFKAANTSQAQKISQQLQNPFAQKMQLLMGGSDPYSPQTSGDL